MMCYCLIFVSSTYWHTGILISVSSFIEIPLMLQLDLMASASGSACIINRSADIALPCLIPLEIEKYSDKNPLVITALFAQLYMVSIQEIKRPLNLNFLNTSNNHRHSTRPKAFSWSSSTITDSSSFACIISSTSLIFSTIYQPLMHPPRSVLIISGKM